MASGAKTSECFTHWSCDVLYPLNRTKYHKLRQRYLASRISSTSHSASGPVPRIGGGSSYRGRPPKGSSSASCSFTTGKTGCSPGRGGGEFELVRTTTNHLGHAEGTEALVRKFLGRPGRLNVRGVQPHAVADFNVRSRGSPAVVVPLILLLGFHQRRFCFRNAEGDPVAKLVDRLNPGASSGGFEAHPREPAGVGHERHLLGGGGHVVIVRKLSGREELVPVVLLVVGEQPNELLELLVDALRLTIGLRVVRRGGRRSNSG